eukprot:COSAG03_NODE_111_length_12507_cov_28.124355_11_plen_487_part_00
MARGGAWPTGGVGRGVVQPITAAEREAAELAGMAVVTDVVATPKPSVGTQLLLPTAAEHEATPPNLGVPGSDVSVTQTRLVKCCGSPLHSGLKNFMVIWVIWYLIVATTFFARIVLEAERCAWATGADTSDECPAGMREERGLCRDLGSDCFAPGRDHTTDERAVCACDATVVELPAWRWDSLLNVGPFPIPVSDRDPHGRFTCCVSTSDSSYSITYGSCRGGPVWEAPHNGAGELWDCSPTGSMSGVNYAGMTVAECEAACDADDDCGAFDIEGHATNDGTRSECCLFRDGNMGTDGSGRHCYVRRRTRAVQSQCVESHSSCGVDPSARCHGRCCWCAMDSGRAAEEQTHIARGASYGLCAVWCIWLRSSIARFSTQNLKRGVLCGSVLVLFDCIVWAAEIRRKSKAHDDYDATPEVLQLVCLSMPSQMWVLWAVWCLAVQIEIGEITEEQPNGHPRRRAVVCLGCDRGAVSIEQARPGGAVAGA